MANAAPVKVTRAVNNTTIHVLKFAELLEQLEIAFYKQVLNKFQPADFTAADITVPNVAIQNFQLIMAHESAHVLVLDQALGVPPQQLYIQLRPPSLARCKSLRVERRYTVFYPQFEFISTHTRPRSISCPSASSLYLEPQR